MFSLPFLPYQYKFELNCLEWSIIQCYIVQDILQRYTTECEILHRTNRWHIHRPIKNERKSNLSGAKKYHGIIRFSKRAQSGTNQTKEWFIKHIVFFCFDLLNLKINLLFIWLLMISVRWLLWKYHVRTTNGGWTANWKEQNITYKRMGCVSYTDRLLSMSSTLNKQHCMTFACNLVFDCGHINLSYLDSI